MNYLCDAGPLIYWLGVHLGSNVHSEALYVSAAVF